MKTRPTPIAFLLAYVTYTAVSSESLNFSLFASIGIICITGIVNISSFGLYLSKQPFSISHLAPSRYNPLAKQPNYGFFLISDES